MTDDMVITSNIARALTILGLFEGDITYTEFAICMWDKYRYLVNFEGKTTTLDDTLYSITDRRPSPYHGVRSYMRRIDLMGFTCDGPGVGYGVKTIDLSKKGKEALARWRGDGGSFPLEDWDFWRKMKDRRDKRNKLAEEMTEWIRIETKEAQKRFQDHFSCSAREADAAWGEIERGGAVTVSRE